MSKANSDNSISRRGVMASIGAITMLAPLTANAKETVTAKTIDPVFAAIERHRSAYTAWLKPLHDETEMLTSDPRYAALAKIAEPFRDEQQNSAEALADIIPTTMAGVLALLAYIDEVNRDIAIPRSSRPTNERATDFNTWPDQLFFADDGKSYAAAWPFLVMANIKTALTAITANRSAAG